MGKVIRQDWSWKNEKKISNNKFFKSRKWRQLRYKAFQRYGKQCQCCGAKPPEIVLHVDHVKPRSSYPALEMLLSNLQILCEDCNIGKNTDDADFR